MKLAVGIPAYGSRVHGGHVLQAAQLSWAWAKAGLPSPMLFLVDTCLIDKARNLLVANARDAKADWLLMCDADTYFPVAPKVFALLAEGQKQSAAVIAAPVRMRKRDGYNVAKGAEYMTVPPEEFRGKVMPIDHIGAAFMAINLGWLVANWAHSPWFRVEHIGGWQPQHRGEDYAFCAGVRERGGLILCDGRFEPAHDGASSHTAVIAEMGGQVLEC